MPFFNTPMTITRIVHSLRRSKQLERLADDARRIEESVGAAPLSYEEFMARSQSKSTTLTDLAKVLLPVAIGLAAGAVLGIGLTTVGSAAFGALAWPGGLLPALGGGVIGLFYANAKNETAEDQKVSDYERYLVSFREKANGQVLANHSPEAAMSPPANLPRRASHPARSQ